MISRLKFEYQALANKMLDKLPSSVWTSETTTFIDPSMGGGQFLSVIQTRLKDAGHSDKNIASRIFGYEDNKLRINYAVNKHKLLGNFVHKKILDETLNRKFSVVVCNPPFESPNTVAKDRKQPQNHSLWPKYVNKAFEELVEDNGYVCFTTPDSWMSPTNKVFQMFKKYNLLWANVDCKEYFPKVGTSSTAWVGRKQQSSIETDFEFVKLDINQFPYLPRMMDKSISIHKKVLNFDAPKLNVLGDNTCHGSKSVVSTTQDSKFKYPLHHTNAQMRYGSIKSAYQDNIKVLWTTSGNYIPKVDLGVLGFTEPNQTVIVDTKEQVNALFSVLNSKLYHYIVTTAKWSGFLNGSVFKLLPDLGTNKIWSDCEIYEIFGLSDKEISTIEEYFKPKTVDNTAI